MEAHSGIGRTLLDSLQTSLTAAAEIGANRLLAYDPQALARCAELRGQCIAIDVTDLDFQVYCHPGDWGLRLSREAPPREVDASISGRLIALLDLAAEEDKVSTSIRGRVSFSGNVAVAQKLQKILLELDIDWEEILAHQVGDVVAFQVGERARRTRDWLRHGADSLLQTSSEYLREEARLSPTQVEFDRFQDRVTELKHDVARLDARLQRILRQQAR